MALEEFVLAAGVPLAGGLVLSWTLEACLSLRPRPPWRRPASALFLHAGLWMLAFALAWAVVRRPYFAAALALAGAGLIVVVNNAKYQALREPFVWADFEYFTDALRHPRLYLPFLGLWRALGAAAGAGAALAAGLMLESPEPAGAGAMALGLGGAALAGAAGSRPVRISFDARKDLRRLGLAMALWRYAKSERRKEDPPATPFSAPAAALPETLPDLVSVQSESFFDPRSLYPQIRPALLAEFDALRAGASAHGPLRVASWGANTVRTEFAFLTGLDAGRQGVHRYQPYRRLARSGLASLAGYLRGLGYRTVCVHPYHRGFYGRDRVLPLLGFDEFIDIAAFEGGAPGQPYVGDRDVAARVIELLGQARTGPLYVHVITMENHGPLHWERVDAADEAAVCREPLPADCRDLVAYCRHLGNADAMFGMLARALAALPRPAGLCIYGDHVPIMPGVYRRLGAPSGETEYLIWRTEGDARAPAAPLAASDLGQAFLARMGLMPAA
ncbi:LTA synthase family protein [Achromobacter denitrificans]|uniref:LTA synthase family protein n=1 Tax=Achromobacter denitrificans TaxID=32002 RepID=UPI0023E87827|nr:LTA synthase family protein [Achromobacter denitrificans]MDF3847850.1 LTA synthase family protein [Achromobacter denitrificans]